MRFAIDESERGRAKTPHELFIVNVFAFHLLLTPAAIALGIGRLALLVPLLLSGVVITFIYLRARHMAAHGPWFVAAHWRLALRRCRWLLMAYAASGAVLLLVWLLTMGTDDVRTQDIMLTVFTRIAIMPTFVTLLVTFVLEAQGINQAMRGELPERIAAQFPPPQGVVQLEEEAVA